MKDIRKRIFDVLGATLGLIVLSPVMLCVAILVWVKMGRPVLFRQSRPGLLGKPFTLYKFRTMTEARGVHQVSLSEETRLTEFGKFLRSTSLDELPELWNVLEGSMSLVGPRPLLMEYLPLYDEYQFRRHEVKPGITGWAQINGRNAITWEEKFEYDVWYVENRSVLLDLRIIWETFGQVARREAIQSPGHPTMPPFTGSKESDNDWGATRSSRRY